MKSVFSKWRREVCALMLIAFSSGCASTNDASAPVGMQYSHGVLTAVEAAAFDPVWRATLAALDASDVTVLDSERTVTGGTMDGRTPDLKAIKVNIRRLSESKTELQIRIDTFGNSELAHIIYEKFQIALKPTQGSNVSRLRYLQPRVFLKANPCAPSVEFRPGWSA